MLPLKRFKFSKVGKMFDALNIYWVSRETKWMFHMKHRIIYRQCSSIFINKANVQLYIKNIIC